jgi:hypothetical protein
MIIILICPGLTFSDFWRAGASSSITMIYLLGPRKRVTKFVQLVIVYILARGRQ